MLVKQISLSLDNVPGKLQDVSQLLGAERINIRGISVADTADISTIRLIVDDPERTINILKSQGYSIRETDVIALEVPDHPGGLQAILKPLKRAKINVLFLYPYLGRGGSGQAIIIMGVDRINDAIKVLKDNWVHIFGKEVYSL